MSGLTCGWGASKRGCWLSAVCSYSVALLSVTVQSTHPPRARAIPSSARGGSSHHCLACLCWRTGCRSGGVTRMSTRSSEHRKGRNTQVSKCRWDTECQRRQLGPYSQCSITSSLVFRVPGYFSSFKVRHIIRPKLRVGRLSEMSRKRHGRHLPAVEYVGLRDGVA